VLCTERAQGRCVYNAFDFIGMLFSFK